jgi:hypothetical protein
MHSTQRPFTGVNGDVALHQPGIQSHVLKVVLRPAERKETTLVDVGFQMNFENTL